MDLVSAFTKFWIIFCVVAGTRIAKINQRNMQPCQDGEEQHGVGPDRCWPGGLALSRSIGDFDGGKALICSPQVVQVQIPSEGVRLILCTDGVWDYWNNSKMASNFVKRWVHVCKKKQLLIVKRCVVSEANHETV